MYKVFEINFIEETRILVGEFALFDVALYRSHRFASIKCKDLNENSKNRYHIIKEENGCSIECYDNSEKIYKYEVGEY